MNFEEFEAEDFLQEESFLNYCLSANPGHVEFWNTWLRLHPEKTETVSQARNMYLVLNGNISSEQFKQHENEFLTAFRKHNDKPAASSTFRIWKYIAAAAASVVIFLFVYKGFFEKGEAVLPVSVTTYSTNIGEHKKFTLPDGSTLLLNGGSSVTFSKDFNKHGREVGLKGEGFFEVTHNKARPFIIHTPAMDVRVLGTVFNVKAYPSEKETETVLLEGSVEITLNNEAGKKIILRPNQKITTFANGNNIVSEIEKKKDTKESYEVTELTHNKTGPSWKEVSWTTEQLSFSNVRFTDIATELRNRYQVDIIFENEQVKDYRFTATFEKKNIIEVLNALQLSRKFKFRTNDNNTIYISR